MAQKVARQLVDDLDGSPAVATVRFGYAGHDYEIDLSEVHATELEEFLARYREHTRQVNDGGQTGRRRRPSRPPRQPRQDTPAIRQWAWDHGYQVSATAAASHTWSPPTRPPTAAHAEVCPTVAV